MIFKCFEINSLIKFYTLITVIVISSHPVTMPVRLELLADRFKVEGQSQVAMVVVQHLAILLQHHVTILEVIAKQAIVSKPRAPNPAMVVRANQV